MSFDIASIFTVARPSRHWKAALAGGVHSLMNILSQIASQPTQDKREQLLI